MRVTCRDVSYNGGKRLQCGAAHPSSEAGSRVIGRDSLARLKRGVSTEARRGRPLRPVAFCSNPAICRHMLRIEAPAARASNHSYMSQLVTKEAAIALEHTQPGCEE